MTNLESIDKKIKEDKSKERDAKCEPVAEEIIQIIARIRPSVSQLKDHEDMLKRYTPIQQAVAQLFVDHDLSISEINYTWSIVQQVFDESKSLTINSIQMAFELCERKLFGVDNTNDVTMSKMDAILKSVESSDTGK